MRSPRLRLSVCGAAPVLASLVVLSLGCGTDGAESTSATPSDDTAVGTDGVPEDVPDTAAPVEDVPDTAAEDADDASVEETATPDLAGSDTVDAADPPDVPEGPTPFATPWAPWLPAVNGNVLATVDAKGLRFQLVGGIPLEVTTFAPGETPTSPVAVPSGLLCWDVNGSLALEAVEDLDFDGKGTPADCALQPIPNPGRAGFLFAVNADTGGSATCQLRAYTGSADLAWSADFSGTCQRPTLVFPYAVVPMAAGATGVVRLVDVRDGTVRSQITLATEPVTPAAFVGDGRYAIATGGGLVVIGVSTVGGTALFLNNSTDLAPDQPTAVLRAGPTQVAVVVRGVGAPDDALGTAIRVFALGQSSLTEQTFALDVPGPIWAAPISSVLGGKWFLAVGGTDWVTVFNPTTGSVVRKVTVAGTVSALAWGADGRVQGVSWDWDGNPALRGGSQWTAFDFDPGASGTVEVIETGSVALPIRAIAAPAVLCDVAVAQVFLDGAVPSAAAIYKPCAGSLAAGGYARPSGDNGNSGLAAAIPDCASGPGVVPCEATSGCDVNTDCDDNNSCTVDSCIQSQCSYKFLPGCCSSDAQCNDFDPCTENRCVSGKCQYPAAASCCESSSDCDDQNACTLDACEAGTCEHSVNKGASGCCASDLECATNLKCVKGTCNLDSKSCEVTITTNCCTSDLDCGDGNICTKDSCVEGQCTFAPDPTQFGCCESDADCTTGNVCILGLCDTTKATCQVTPIPDCCLTNVQCDDKDACTKDACVDQVCGHTLDPTPKGCCDDDADCSVELTACIFAFSCDVELAKCELETKNCDDKDPCTKDWCELGECKHQDIPGCCNDDADCDDKLICTKDSCDPDVHVCTADPLTGCCSVDADCADQNPATTETCVANACVVHTCETHPFTSTTLPLDLVVVVDQSTSMTDEIPLVQTYLNDLATWLGTAGIDYHVSLIASRQKGANAICIAPPLAGPNCQNSSTFRQIDQQVASHDSLLQVMSHIDELEAFMRPSSSRQFVVFSDDASDVTAEAFAFFVEGRPGYGSWAFHAFVGFDGTSCALTGGQDYLDLAVMSGGVRYDICSTSWANSYPQLGKVAEDAGTSFPISMYPIPGTVTVSYNNAPLANGVGYTYDGATNRVTLVEPLPPPGGQLQICFDANVGPTGGP